VIKAEIEQTRTEMSDTINAIQERLSPQNLLDQAKDTVREATIGRVEEMVSNVTDTAKDTGGNLMQMIKDNPLPAALVGLGLGWLFLKKRDSSPKSEYGYRDASGYRSGTHLGQDYRGDYPYGSRSSGDYSRQSEGIVEQAIDRVKQNPLPAALAGAGLGLMLLNKGDSSSQNRPSSYGYSQGRSEGGIGQAVQNAGEKIGDTAGDVADKVGDVAGRAGDAIGSAAGQVKDTAGDVAGAVAHTAGNVAGGAGDVVGKVLRTVGENPIPAALAGLSIGWLVMQSNNEGQERLEQVGEKVGEVASNAGGAVGDAAGNVADTVKHGAEAAQTGFQRLLMGYPLAAGALAVGVGAAIGLAVPETQKEHEVLGTARDKLMDKAQTVAHDALDKVQEVSDNVMQRVDETASDVQSSIESKVAEGAQA
jgi:gas vesicle protein